MVLARIKNLLQKIVTHNYPKPRILYDFQLWSYFINDFKYSYVVICLLLLYYWILLKANPLVLDIKALAQVGAQIHFQY